MHKRDQSVVSNCHSSKFQNDNAGVPQGIVLGPLLSLICINDLPLGLHSDVELFADNTLLFSEIHDLDASSLTLTDLIEVQDWAYNWKMSFNLDRSKQAQKVFFGRKTKKGCIPVSIYCNNWSVYISVAHKHQG